MARAPGTPLWLSMAAGMAQTGGACWSKTSRDPSISTWHICSTATARARWRSSNSENIGLYQIKNEFGGQAVTIRGSRHIRAIGFGGWLFPGTPEGKFFVDRSSDVTFAGFIWNFKPSDSNGHPVVRVKQSDGVELTTKPYAMPTFFSIGRSTPGSPQKPAATPPESNK